MKLWNALWFAYTTFKFLVNIHVLALKILFFSSPALERLDICFMYEKYLATSPSYLCFLKIGLQSLCFGLFWETRCLIFKWGLTAGYWKLCMATVEKICPTCFKKIITFHMPNLDSYSIFIFSLLQSSCIKDLMISFLILPTCLLK